MLSELEIGDKITVAYSYSEFDKNSDEREALNTILTSAQNEGLRFISDSDARPQGGAHVSAHLWDNGNNASEELDNILQVRSKAISNFSKDNIKTGEPFTVLEDVFVPLYFFHRFQTEATSKVIGGLDYNYAVKGDGQLVTKVVNVAEQKVALKSIMKTLSIETLAIPSDKLELFPPRAFGFSRGRESFSSKTGVAFDPLSAVSTASDMTLKLMLNPQRANRLIQQKSIDTNQLGLDEVLRVLIDNSFKKNGNDTYLNEVQHMINVNVLKYIMNLAVTDTAFFQVNAKANDAIISIVKSLGDSSYDMQYKRLIKQFNEDPEEFKLEKSPKIPDGSPIGSDICNYSSN